MSDVVATLRSEQIDDYHSQGFLSLPAITERAEIARLRDIYDRLFAERAGRAEGNQFDLAGADEDDAPAVLPQILRPARYAPELKQARFRANALAIARQLLGPEAETGGEHAILKPATIGAATPWHQDEAYWNPDLVYNSISVWMPLQEASVENGCLHFIPGSHLSEVQPHHQIGHDPRVHGLEVDSIDPAKAVACPIPAGGATIHHCRTLHYAGPNHTNRPRRAYILIFALPTRARSEPRDFYWQKQWQTARLARRETSEASKDGNRA